MNSFYVTVGAVIVVLFLGILFFQGNNKTNSPVLAPSSQLPSDTSPSPVDSNSIIKGSTPAPTNTPTPTPTPAPKPISATKATITTQYGDIVLELYPQETPITVDNFARKVKSGFYNGLTFHRVEDWVVQGGDPKGNGSGGNDTLKPEYTNRPFVSGSLGIARKNDPSTNNDSQFFITKQDASSLTGQYTNFGTVTSGMDVVGKIQVGDKILKITVE